MYVSVNWLTLQHGTMDPPCGGYEIPQPPNKLYWSLEYSPPPHHGPGKALYWTDGEEDLKTLAGEAESQEGAIKDTDGKGYHFQI